MSFLMNNKISALILFMPNELVPTQMCVESLLRADYENFEVLILQNGIEGTEFSESFTSDSRVKFFAVHKNLGVAGGRNYLLNQVSDESEFISVLDNDLLVPRDYFKLMSSSYSSDIGILGSVVFDYKEYLLSPYFLKFIKTSNELTAYTFDLTNKDFANYYKTQKRFLNENEIFHMGMNFDYRTVYFLNILKFYRQFTSKMKRKVKILDRCELDLKKSIYHRSLIYSDKLLSVSNVAGCCQFFSVSFFKKIGFYDDRFNPYGFEDVDYSIRSIKLGYSNKTLMNSFLVHGTDERHSVRNPSSPHLIIKYRALFRLFDKYNKSQLSRCLFFFNFILCLSLRVLFSFNLTRIRSLKQRLVVIVTGKKESVKGTKK